MLMLRFYRYLKKIFWSWFWLFDEKMGKMSKIKGNVVYPEMLVERYSLDCFAFIT